MHVPAVYVIIVIGSIDFSSWVHKQLLKLDKIHAFWHILLNFTYSEDLCKLGRIFKCTDMQILYVFPDKILKLLTYHTPFFN